MMRTPPQERIAMGARARQLTIERFGLEAVLDQWQALYASLLNRQAQDGAAAC
jgi:hypothetical protein